MFRNKKIYMAPFDSDFFTDEDNPEMPPAAVAPIRNISHLT